MALTVHRSPEWLKCHHSNDLCIFWIKTGKDLFGMDREILLCLPNCAIKLSQIPKLVRVWLFPGYLHRPKNRAGDKDIFQIKGSKLMEWLDFCNSYYTTWFNRDLNEEEESNTVVWTLSPIRTLGTARYYLVIRFDAKDICITTPVRWGWVAEKLQHEMLQTGKDEAALNKPYKGNTTSRHRFKTDLVLGIEIYAASFASYSLFRLSATCMRCRIPWDT